MVRKLKFHEQKLLKKVDFISWKSDNNLGEVKIWRKYHIQKREDYTKYKLSGLVTSLANKIKQLDPKDSFRAEATEELLEKLYSMGLIQSKNSLSLCEKLPARTLCRRRFIVVSCFGWFGDGSSCVKVTVDLQRPNFMIFLFFAHNIAKTSI